MVVLTAIVVAGCTSPIASPAATPVPSPTPHTPLTSTLLQITDVPTGLARCPNSGPFDAYVDSLKSSDANLTKQWSDLKKAGATDAAINIFAADQSACSAELGAAPNVKAATSLVLAFGDEGQADRAWQAGILGFAPPVPGEQPPGVSRGVSTGLGQSSWTYVKAPVQMATWRKKIFVALVVFTNLDTASFSAGAATVNARLT